MSLIEKIEGYFHGVVEGALERAKEGNATEGDLERLARVYGILKRYAEIQPPLDLEVINMDVKELHAATRHKIGPPKGD